MDSTISAVSILKTHIKHIKIVWGQLDSNQLSRV